MPCLLAHCQFPLCSVMYFLLHESMCGVRAALRVRHSNGNRAGLSEGSIGVFFDQLTFHYLLHTIHCKHKSSKCVISPLIFPWPGHRQWVRRGADQALVCESLHERPVILQLVEAAAAGAEADAGLFLRWMCQRGHRVLLSDSGHTAQCWRGLHPHRPARFRLTDSRHRLLLFRVTYKRTRTPLCSSDNIVAEEILWFRTVLSPRALQETSHVTAHRVAGSWMYSISDQDHY